MPLASIRSIFWAIALICSLISAPAVLSADPAEKGDNRKDDSKEHAEKGHDEKGHADKGHEDKEHEEHEHEEEEESRCIDQRVLLGLFRPVIGCFPTEKEPHDLTLGNFFSYGWNVGWKEPEEGPHDAPRFRLLRIQQAFWEREYRYTHNYAFGVDHGSLDEQEGEAELELPVSRRFMLEFEMPYAGRRPAGEQWTFGGGDLVVIPEVMLWETHDLSFSSGLFIRTPTGSRSVEEGHTSLTPYLALWKDLGARVGLHTYLGTEIPLSRTAEDPAAILQYAIAPAITVTPKDTPFLGDLTFFTEMNGTTNLGADQRTTVTLLPGVKWMLFKDLWVATGYEFPVTGTETFRSRVWLSLYRDF
jgi:hypothetical protein